MNEYESVYIIKGDLAEDGVKKIQKRMEDVITKNEGVLFSQKNQGSRTLTYPIQKANRGHYILLNFAGPGKIVSEFERNLRITDGVIRFTTVKISDDIDVNKRKQEWSRSMTEEAKTIQEGNAS